MRPGLYGTGWHQLLNQWLRQHSRPLIFFRGSISCLTTFLGYMKSNLVSSVVVIGLELSSLYLEVVASGGPISSFYLAHRIRHYQSNRRSSDLATGLGLHFYYYSFQHSRSSPSLVVNQLSVNVFAESTNHDLWQRRHSAVGVLHWPKLNVLGSSRCFGWAYSEESGSYRSDDFVCLLLCLQTLSPLNYLREGTVGQP